MQFQRDLAVLTVVLSCSSLTTAQVMELRKVGGNTVTCMHSGLMSEPHRYPCTIPVCRTLPAHSLSVWRLTRSAMTSTSSFRRNDAVPSVSDSIEVIKVGLCNDNVTIEMADYTYNVDGARYALGNSSNRVVKPRLLGSRFDTTPPSCASLPQSSLVACIRDAFAPA